MGLTTWVELGNNPMQTADPTAVANTISLTDASPPFGAGGYTCPANVLQPGTGLHIKCMAKFSNTATPTLLLGIYHGGVAGTKLCAIGATTTTVSAVNWPIHIEGWITCRTAGAAGTLIATGFVDLATSLTAVTRIPMDAAAVAAVTVDTTANKAITIGAQWSAASASNTLTVIQFIVEKYNFQ